MWNSSGWKILPDAPSFDFAFSGLFSCNPARRTGSRCRNLQNDCFANMLNFLWSEEKMSSSDFSAQNSYRIDKGKSVWIDLIFLCSLMLQYRRSGNHWSPDGSLDMASNHKAYHKLPVPWQPLFPWKLLFTWSPISVWGRITGKIPRQAGSTPTGTPSCPHKDSFPGWVARSQWYYLPTFSSPMTPSPSHHYLSDIIAHSCWIRLMA